MLGQIGIEWNKKPKCNAKAKARSEYSNRKHAFVKPRSACLLGKMNMNPRENGKGMVIGVVEWPMFMVGMAGQRV
jgi:hypothetical protein